MIDGDWCDLPVGIMAALKTASRFVSPEPVKPNVPTITDHKKYVHFYSGRLLATNNLNLVEFNLGPCSLADTALLPSEIKLLASFGSDPTHATISGDRIAFRFRDGETCEIQQCSFPDRYTPFLNEHWRMGESAIETAPWASAFTGQFSVQAAAGTLKLTEDGVSSFEVGIENQTSTVLNFRTGAPNDRYFGSWQLVQAVKIANKIDFSARHASYTHALGRGLLVSSSLWSREAND